MEFEKRWCMFLTTTVWLILKGLFFYTSIGYNIPVREEYIHYALNAFILTLVFSRLESYIETRVGKSFLATFMSALFVVQIIAENYMLTYLRYMPYSSWEWSFKDATISGLTRYIKYGYPGYHWAFLTMLAICFIIIALRASKPKIMNIIKDGLFKKAEKTKRSLYFTILFEHFLYYITIGEYICLKDWYLNSDIKWSVISRVFEEKDWKEMDSIIFDPVVEYLERQKKIEQSNETEPESNKKELEKNETNESKEQKVEIIDDNNDIPSDDINKEVERLE